MKKLPNILTSLRLISVPFIVLLFINNRVWWTIFLIVAIAGTDFLDGLLARKLNAQSELGARLDAACDKIFSAGLLLTISTKFNFLLINLFIEVIITIVNLYFFSKVKKSKTLFIGKVKTWFLFATVTVGFIVYFNYDLMVLLNVFVCMTAILQVVCIFAYIKSGIYLTTHHS